MTYAKGTSVSVDSSQQEITRILHRYKIDTYTFGSMPGSAVVQFQLDLYPIRVAIPLPARPEVKQIKSLETGRMVDAGLRWQQDIKEAWRALVLLIKANLEAVERGITTVEKAFMAYLILADGHTLGDQVLPAYQRSLTTGHRLELEA